MGKDTLQKGRRTTLYPNKKAQTNTFEPNCSGECGIRTHVRLPSNGFQDRLVMTASITLRVFSCGTLSIPPESRFPKVIIPYPSPFVKSEIFFFQDRIVFSGCFVAPKPRFFRRPVALTKHKHLAKHSQTSIRYTIATPMRSAPPPINRIKSKENHKRRTIL